MEKVSGGAAKGKFKYLLSFDMINRIKIHEKKNKRKKKRID